jgi:hypothetical protein
MARRRREPEEVLKPSESPDETWQLHDAKVTALRALADLGQVAISMEENDGGSPLPLALARDLLANEDGPVLLTEARKLLVKTKLIVQSRLDEEEEAELQEQKMAEQATALSKELDVSDPDQVTDALIAKFYLEMAKAAQAAGMASFFRGKVLAAVKQALQDEVEREMEEA